MRIIIKIIKKFYLLSQLSATPMHNLFDFFTQIAIIHIPAFAMKEYVRMLRFYKENHAKWKDLTNKIVDSLVTFVKNPYEKALVPSDIFLFYGADKIQKKNSGIKLIEFGNIPKSGYCFFGSIRLERSEPDDDTKMVIYKIKNNENEMCLYINNEQKLIYEVSEIVESKRENRSVKQLYARPLECDKWIFIELFHLNGGEVVSSKDMKYILFIFFYYYQLYN